MQYSELLCSKHCSWKCWVRDFCYSGWQSWYKTWKNRVVWVSRTTRFCCQENNLSFSVAQCSRAQVCCLPTKTKQKDLPRASKTLELLAWRASWQSSFFSIPDDRHINTNCKISRKNLFWRDHMKGHVGYGHLEIRDFGWVSFIVSRAVLNRVSNNDWFCIYYTRQLA